MKTDFENVTHVLEDALGLERLQIAQAADYRRGAWFGIWLKRLTLRNPIPGHVSESIWETVR